MSDLTSDEKFRWSTSNVLWHANSTRIAGWVGYDANSMMYYARTAGTLDQPFVRAEFDNKEAAQDFLLFIAHAENQ
jgi:hypothetical protein